MEVELSDPNWFDVIVFSVITVSTLFAFFKGFIKTFFSFLNWVGAATIAIVFYPSISGYMEAYVSDERAIKVLSYALLFIASLLVLIIVNSRLVFLLRSYRWGVMDRTLGFGFGLLRGALIVSVVFFSIDITSSMLHLKQDKAGERAGPSWFVEAKTYQLLKLTTEFFMSMAPENVTEVLEQTVENIGGISGIEVVGEVEEEKKTDIVLSSDEKAILRQVILALPKDDIRALYKEHNNKNGELTDLERFFIYRDIVSLYDKAEKSNGIKAEKRVSEEKVARLKKTLGYETETEKENEVKSFLEGGEEGLGYKGKNLKQLDRLINNFSE